MRPPEKLKQLPKAVAVIEKLLLEGNASEWSLHRAGVVELALQFAEESSQFTTCPAEPDEIPGLVKAIEDQLLELSLPIKGGRITAREELSGREFPK